MLLPRHREPADFNAKRQRKFTEKLNLKQRKKASEHIRQMRYLDRERKWANAGRIKHYREELGVPTTRKVAAIIKEKGKCRILDLGCGSGRFLAQLKRIFGEKVETHGLSIQNPKNPKIDKMHVGLFETARFAGKFDIIVSNHSLQYALNTSMAVQNACNSLEKGGEAFLHIGGKESPFTKVGRKETALVQKIVEKLNQDGFQTRIVEPTKNSIVLHIKNAEGKKAVLRKTTRQELRKPIVPYSEEYGMPRD